jgi:branched-chain amino acid transport system substrate-binding protein
MIAALDHPSISEGPGGPAETVPGQHHVRMNRYIARSEGGTFTVVENLGRIGPRKTRGDDRLIDDGPGRSRRSQPDAATRGRPGFVFRVGDR